MAEYLATGRNPEGKTVTERLEADSADEAVAILRDRGFEEVVLHTDDVSAHYIRQGEVAEVFTPRQYLWFRDMPGALAGFLLLTIMGYRKGWLFHLLELGILILRRYEGHPWGFFDSVLVSLLLFPPIFALAAQFFQGAAGRYNALIEAGSWGRWEEVLRRVDSVGASVPPEELAFRKGQALAGLGRLDEGLRVVEPFGDGEAMPEWLYLSRLPELYRAAKQPGPALAALEQAMDLAPDNAIVLLEGARTMIWYERNPRRARELLDQARSHALSDVMAPFATFVDGMIRHEEGHAQEARTLLEQAFEDASRFRHASPLMGTAIDLIHSGLALACAAQGDTEAARRHFRLARPRLEALKLDDAIARCEQAIGAL